MHWIVLYVTSIYPVKLFIFNGKIYPKTLIQEVMDECTKNAGRIFFSMTGKISHVVAKR